MKKYEVVINFLNGEYKIKKAESNDNITALNLALNQLEENERLNVTSVNMVELDFEKFIADEVKHRWSLSDEVGKMYEKMIEKFIIAIESSTPEDKLLEIDLSNTELNPYTLQALLEGLGYEVTERDNNGWQLDFWINMEKPNFKNLSINGTGITFELKLSELEL